jgi:hypothetical protein
MLASSPHATVYINTTETLLSVNPPASKSSISEFLHPYSFSTLVDWAIEIFYIFLLATIPIAFLAAHRRKKTMLANKREESMRAATLADLWLTPSWMAFFGLCDLYILGVLPTGPWKGSAHKSLKAWDEKRYLRRLVHMGIVPLQIQDGGVGTRREKALEITERWPWVSPPIYVQSKRRSYFEFLVPMAKGYSQPKDLWRDPRTTPFKRFVQSLLHNHHGFSVTISNAAGDITIHNMHPEYDLQDPREVGASSLLQVLLPFKPDRVLQSHKGPDELDISDFIKPGFSPLLDTRGCPLLRIENVKFGKRRLDEWVYGMAQKAGLGRVWNEGALHAHASEWIRQNELELPEYLIPSKDRL